MSKNSVLNSDDRLAASPAKRIMMILKMQGSETAARIGQKLGITGEAVRQQLVRLSEEGLVVARTQSQGVGRPSLYWDLTGEGHGQFPDTHADLTVQILENIRTVLGADALEAIIAAREVQTRIAYQHELAGLTSLRSRVERLVQLRSDEGYMAELEEGPEGTLVLVENHCPICAAATACQGFCRAELEVFRHVLGPDVQIERTDHILLGARRCAYVIRNA